MTSLPIPVNDQAHPEGRRHPFRHCQEHGDFANREPERGLLTRLLPLSGGCQFSPRRLSTYSGDPKLLIVYRIGITGAKD